MTLIVKYRVHLEVYWSTDAELHRDVHVFVCGFVVLVYVRLEYESLFSRM